MKVRLVRAELFHADGRSDRRTDGQTDMTKLTVAFRLFVNGRKKGLSLALTGTFVHKGPRPTAPGGKGGAVYS
jgi:hypothetical protein